MSKSTSLYEFGYNFLGPMCSEYFHAFMELCQEQTPDTVLFLAREGYFFEKVYKQVIEQRLSDKPDAHYLLVSRTFLFRVLIGDKRSWQWSLGHKFSGTLKQLLLGRFGFSLPQIENVFSEEEFESEWELPEQIEELSELLESYREQLGSIVNDSRANYVEYLLSLNLAKANCPLIVDVGYSGHHSKIIIFAAEHRYQRVVLYCDKRRY